jgi:hypothetical protein
MLGKYEEEESIKHQITFQDLMGSSHKWINDTVPFDFAFRQSFVFQIEGADIK